MTPIAAFIAAMLSVFGVAATPADYELAVRGTQVQLAPPPTVAASAPTGPCAEWVHLLEQYDPGWDIGHFQRIMWRESRCDPNAHNPSGATGLLQLMPFWAGHLAHCDVHTRTDLYDPVKNICGAAHVYTVQGINAWSQTK